MATTLQVFTSEDLAPIIAEQKYLRLMLESVLELTDDDLTTEQALKFTGIKARATLLKLRTKELNQYGFITYRKEGTRSVYSRKSCLAYKHRHSIPATLRIVK